MAADWWQDSEWQDPEWQDSEWQDSEWQDSNWLPRASRAGSGGGRGKRGAAVGRGRATQWRKREQSNADEVPGADGNSSAGEIEKISEASRGACGDVPSPAEAKDHSPHSGQPVDRAQLERELKAIEQKASQREASVARLTRDIARLHAESSQSLAVEERSTREANEFHSGARSSEEALHCGQTELLQRVAELEQRIAEHQTREREWREDLSSTQHQKEAAVEQVAELERDVSRWQAAALEQAKRVAKAEAKVKSCEARRAELASATERLERQASDARAVADASQKAAQELAAGSQRQGLEAAKQKTLWKAASVFLFMVAAWLALLPLAV